MFRQRFVNLTREACNYLGSHYHDITEQLLKSVDLLLALFECPRVYADVEMVRGTRKGLNVFPMCVCVCVFSRYVCVFSALFSVCFLRGDVFGSSDDDDVDVLFYLYARHLAEKQEGQGEGMGHFTHALSIVVHCMELVA